MALNLEDLKVGETYINEGYVDKEIIFIGTEMIAYKYLSNTGAHVYEGTTSIKDALQNFSPKPKPKKAIELVTLIHDHGEVKEYSINGFDYINYYKDDETWTRISSRTVECE